MLRQNNLQPVDKLQQLNDPGDLFKHPGQLLFMRTLIDVIRQILSEMISRDTAAPHLILRSPNGTAYRVTVADDGKITTVNARG